MSVVKSLAVCPTCGRVVEAIPLRDDASRWATLALHVDLRGWDGAVGSQPVACAAVGDLVLLPSRG